MIEISITERSGEENSLLYIKNSLTELLSRADCKATVSCGEKRSKLSVICPEYYAEIIKAEASDKIAEVLAVKYKYDFFKENIKLAGLSEIEREIMMASLIAADLPEDKRYSFEKVKNLDEIAIDGVYNFRLQALKKKWVDVSGYMPRVFLTEQLKDFLTYLIENRKKRVYVDNGKVYDNHYKRLKRCDLLPEKGAKITREVILSNCGEVELVGELASEDEFYLKEYYGDKIFFSNGYFS